MSSPSLDRDALKAAAAPWKSPCKLAGILRSVHAFSIAVIALPRAAPGARLKDTVTEGNCPWWLMESGDFTVSKRVNALSGTALAGAELLLAFDALVAVLAVAPTPELRAFSGGVRTPDEGVNLTEVVRAFEPAAADPDDAKEEKAGAPVAPVDVFAWT